MTEISVQKLMRVLRLAGIKLTSDFTQQLLQDPDVMLAINEEFLDDLFGKLIDAGILNPESLSDQNLWRTAKQYLLEHRGAK